MATKTRSKPARADDEDKAPAEISQAARLYLAHQAALQIADLCEGLCNLNPKQFESSQGYGNVVMAIAKRGNDLSEIIMTVAGDENAQEDSMIRELELHEDFDEIKSKWLGGRMPWQRRS